MVSVTMVFLTLVKPCYFYALSFRSMRVACTYAKERLEQSTLRSCTHLSWGTFVACNKWTVVFLFTISCTWCKLNLVSVIFSHRLIPIQLILIQNVSVTFWSYFPRDPRSDCWINSKERFPGFPTYLFIAFHLIHFPNVPVRHQIAIVVVRCRRSH